MARDLLVSHREVRRLEAAAVSNLSAKILAYRLLLFAGDNAKLTVFDVVRRANKSDGGPRNRSSTAERAIRSKISGAQRSSGDRLWETADCGCDDMEDRAKNQEGDAFLFHQTTGII